MATAWHHLQQEISRHDACFESFHTTPIHIYIHFEYTIPVLILTRKRKYWFSIKWPRCVHYLFSISISILYLFPGIQLSMQLPCNLLMYNAGSHWRQPFIASLFSPQPHSLYIRNNSLGNNRAFIIADCMFSGNIINLAKTGPGVSYISSICRK